jgi:hypothetical protein
MGMVKYYAENETVLQFHGEDESIRFYTRKRDHIAAFNGITGGLRGTSPSVGINVCRGTLENPENTQPGDILSSFAIRGHYGDYDVGAIAITARWADDADLTNLRPGSHLYLINGNNRGDYNIVELKPNGTLKAPLFQAAGHTTKERDELVPENGMIIYNSDLKKIQAYENGQWVNLIR